MNTLTEIPLILEQDEWIFRCDTHLKLARQFTSGPRQRRVHGEKHPIEDFLFNYYPYPFALLEQWQPGLGVAVRFSDPNEIPSPYGNQRYRLEGSCCFLDVNLMKPKERERLEWIVSLLKATQSHVPNFACHGIHEWAMVYQAEEVRHASIAPLRIPQEKIDELVRSRSIACTHHDAFRFFAKDAKPLNRLQPSIETRHENEQPGCVHANMDLYKWAAKSMPWIGAELLLEAFCLATELRDLDMRASPYDLSAWNVSPVKIETPEGRREYEAEQRRLADKAVFLRSKLISVIENILAA